MSRNLTRPGRASTPGSRVRRRRAAAAVLTAALITPLAACGSDSDSSSGSDSDSDAPKVELTVLAAASLTDVFEEAGKAYEKENAGTTLKFSFAGSQELAAQVNQGSPADVLVTADTKTMDDLKGETGKASIIAKNRLVIAVGEGNPEKISELGDLTDPKLKVVLAAPEVPVGRYSREVLDKQDLQVKAVSQEANVRAVLSKVELGEADAGIVYATDAESSPDKIDAVEIPDDENAIASYPAATLNTTKDEDAAADFVEWQTSAKAQKILGSAGFQQP